MKAVLATSIKTSIPVLLGVAGTLVATMAPSYYAAVCGSPLSTLIGG